MNVELKRNKPGKKLFFEILGEPQPKQSVRVSVAMKNGKPVEKITSSGKTSYKLHKYQDKKTINNESYLKWSIAGQLPFGFNLFTGPIAVRRLHYVFYPPEPLIKKIELGCRIYKITRPDLSDNLNKIVFDCMQKLVYKDDSQVCIMEDVKKLYGLQPKILIELEEL